MPRTPFSQRLDREQMNMLRRSSVELRKQVDAWKAAALAWESHGMPLSITDPDDEEQEYEYARAQELTRKARELDG